MLLMASSYFEGFKSLSPVIFSDKRKYLRDLLTHSSLKHRNSMYLLTQHCLPFLPPDHAGQLLSLAACSDSVRGCGQKGHPSVLLQSPASSSLLAALQSSSFSSSLGLHLGKKREQARNYPTLLWYSTGCSCLQLWSCQMRTLKRTKMHSTLPDNTHGFSPVCLLTFLFL